MKTENGLVKLEILTISLRLMEPVMTVSSVGAALLAVFAGLASEASFPWLEVAFWVMMAFCWSSLGEVGAPDADLARDGLTLR